MPLGGIEKKCSGSTFSVSEHKKVLCYKDFLLISLGTPRASKLVLTMLLHILVFHGIDNRIKPRGVCPNSEEL